MEAIGKYRLVELKSRDGDVETWEAEDTSLGRNVTLRIVAEDASDNVRNRFEEEVRAGSGGSPSAPPHILDRTGEGRPYAVYGTPAYSAPGRGTGVVGSAHPEDAAGARTAPNEATVLRPRARPRLRALAAVAVVAVFAAALAVAILGRPRVPASPILAVLPLDGSALSADDAWLAFGATEEIIAALSMTKGLRVTSGSSSRAIAPGTAPAAAASRLGADYLARGSFRVAGTKAILDLELLRADGRRAFKRAFERDATDRGAVARDLGAAAATALAKVAAPGGSLPLEQGSTVDSRAYALYVKARSRTNGATAEDFRAAASMLEEAISLDPAFADALFFLQDCYRELQLIDPAGYTLWTARYGVITDQMTRLLASGNVDAVRARFFGAILAFQEGRYEEAYPTLADLHEQYPGASDLWNVTALAAIQVGKADEASRIWAEELELDPLVVDGWINMQMVKLGARDYAEGIRIGLRAIEIFPDDSLVRNNLGWLYADSGDYEAALAQFSKGAELGGRFSNVWPGYVAALRGERDEALRFASASWEAYRAGREAYCFIVPGIYAVLGMQDEALDRIEPGREDWILRAGLSTWKMYDNLREDPRFTAILKEWGLSTEPPPGYAPGK